MRLLRPSMLVFAVAVLASLSIHLPVYEALGKLAAVLLHAPQPKRESKPVEFELVATPPAELPEHPAPEKAKKPKEKVAKAEKKPEPEKQLQPKPKEPELKVAEVPKPVEVAPVKPPPEDMQQKHAITQKSDDPNVPPPDNPRFIAEENRKVEQETVANQRTTAELDEQPTAAAKQ